MDVSVITLIVCEYIGGHALKGVYEMQFSDPRKLKIVDGMKDIFDIEDFKARCAEQNLPVNGTELEYAQKVGMLLYAKRKYPDVSSLEAYMLLVAGHNVSVVSTGCSSCGGGEVR